jgi:hypothetical protein
MSEMNNTKELKDIVLIMKLFEKPWFIAGGWTIDLAVGEVTRTHKDMDICVFREDVEYALIYFKEWDIKVAIPGENRLEEVSGLTDLDLPRYCLHLLKDKEFLEILLTERINQEVIFRKNKNVSMNIKDFSMGQLPALYVNPAWQLLFKSLSTRPEDEHDFKIYIERVDDNKSKKWLLKNIIMANGNKKWIEELLKYLEEDGDFL